MADNQSSLNENLISAGLNTSNPASTYVDFAEAISRNQREQASQEEALKLAKEHVAQARLSTKQGAEADALGVNPLLLDVMTPDQASSYLKLILKEKGLAIGEDDIKAWVDSLNGAPINRQVVETFANRFARSTAKSNDSFEATADDAKSTKRDENGEPLVAGQMYNAIYDNSGKVVSYVRGGKLPVDPSIKANAKAAEGAKKDWQALNKQIDTAFKTRSGGLGSLTTAVFRSVRAINTINATKNLTAQDLANVSQDIAGIFQGGAPTVVGTKDNDYATIFTNFKDTFRKYTGVLANFRDSAVLEDTKKKLLQVLVDLRDSSIDNLESYFRSQEAAYREAITADPQRWEDMQKEKMEFVVSGLLLPEGGKSVLNITGMEHGQEAKNPADKVTPKSKDDKADAGKDAKKAALRKKLGL